MNNLSLKNYPPSVLITIVCLIAAVNLGVKILWQIIFKHPALSYLQEIVFVFLSYSIAVAVLGFINAYCMNKWFLKLLKLHDVRGIYTGQMLSSYHVDDDPDKPNIKLFCKVNIIQNINALKISGSFFTDQALQERSSSFNSYWEEIKKNDDGMFTIRYFFSNRGNQLHNNDRKYGLNNHDGVCVLTYDPKTKKMNGYYFNHERASSGIINLKYNKR